MTAGRQAGPLGDQLKVGYRQGLAVAAVIAGIGIVVALLSLQTPYGHSGAFNIQAITGFGEQFAEGVLYPRWINGVDGGGGPVFFFYGPLPYWITAVVRVFFCRGCAPQTQMAIALGFMVAASGAAAYPFLRQHASRWASLLGCVVYMMLPYHLAFDAWARSAFGETAAYMWLPIIFWALDQIPRRRTAGPLLALSYAGLIYSHLPSALLASIAIAVYVGLRWFKERDWRFVATAAAAGLAGIVLSAVYLLPALTLQDTIYAKAWWNEFYTAGRWLVGRGDFPDNDTMTVLEGFIFLTLVCFALSALAIPRNQIPHFLWRWIAIAVLCGFLMSLPSAPIWAHVPLLAKVQFPWRLMTIIDLATAQALVAALTLHGQSRVQSLFVRFALGVGLGAAVISLKYAPVLDLRIQLDGRAHQAEILAENQGADYFLPKDVLTAPDVPARIRHARGTIAWLGGGATVPVSYSGETLQVDIDVQKPTGLTIPRFYYPCWVVTLGGAPVSASPDPKTGLISIGLPAGHSVVKVIRKQLRPETAGLAASGGAGIIIIIWLGIAAVRRRSSRGVNFAHAEHP